MPDTIATPEEDDADRERCLATLIERLRVEAEARGRPDVAQRLAWVQVLVERLAAERATSSTLQ